MNPFNQSRYRNEHTLGDSYKIVKDVHDKMDIVKMVADNISNFRSGNIELKGEGALIYWKYAEGTDWFLLMDTTDVFSPLLQNIAAIEEDIDTLTSDIAGNALAIGAINTEATALELRVSDLTTKSITDAEDIATNTSDISAINAELVDIKASITALTGAVSDQATTLSGIADQLSTLQGTVTTQGLSIIDITARVTTLESV